MASLDKRGRRVTRGTKESPEAAASAAAKATRVTKASRASPAWTRLARWAPTACLYPVAAGDQTRNRCPCCRDVKMVVEGWRGARRETARKTPRREARTTRRARTSWTRRATTTTTRRTRTRRGTATDAAIVPRTSAQMSLSFFLLLSYARLHLLVAVLVRALADDLPRYYTGDRFDRVITDDPASGDDVPRIKPVKVLTVWAK